MIRRATIVSFGIVLLVLSTLIPATQSATSAATASTTTVDPLASLYTFKSIYLTYDTLVDIESTLQHMDSSGAPEAVTLLKTFIKTYGGVKYAESVTFLQLNLQDEEAGFMPHGVRGTVTKLQWSHEQVHEVAALVHNYLQTNALVSAQTTALRERHTTLQTAFSSVKQVQHNVLLSPSLRRALNRAFREYVDEQYAALQELRGTDAPLAQEIDTLVAQMDQQREMKPGSPGVYWFLPRDSSDQLVYTIAWEPTTAATTGTSGTASGTFEGATGTYWDWTRTSTR